MRKKTDNHSIQLSTITILAISVSVAAAVVICVFLFATVFNQGLLKDASTNSEQSVQQTAVAVENYLDDLKNKLTNISNEISESGSLEEVKRSISIAVRLEDDINAIVVYNESGDILAFGSDGGELKELPQRNLSFKMQDLSFSDDYAISLPHVQTLFYEKYPWVVTIVRSENQPIFGGNVYVAIDFGFSHIAKYIDNIGIGQHGYSYIMDQKGNIVYHPQQQLIFSGVKSENIKDIMHYGEGVHEEHGIIHTIHELPDVTWRIVGVSYIDDMMVNRMQKTLFGVLLSFIFCAAVAIAVLQLYSKIVTKPVSNLVKAMNSFEKETSTFLYQPKYEMITELKTLSSSFAHMVGMVQDLMDKVRKEELVLRKTELKALQAQINPHFLYNTLDSIQWMCEQGKNEDAVKMVGALASLFRISISRGHELITIKDEIRHAKSYLIIQSFRYKNQFVYQFEVDKSVADCLCNKITIQPLIENAIYHGIDRMVDEGKITVRVIKDTNEDIIIEVQDNGIGMTQEQCRKILQKERSDSSGIGVKNVNDRLKIYFGDNYGITIESELDVGTKVTVRIPQIRKEEENEI